MALVWPQNGFVQQAQSQERRTCGGLQDSKLRSQMGMRSTGEDGFLLLRSKPSCNESFDSALIPKRI
jgi:hypothetical protein